MATLKSIKNKYLTATDGDTIGVKENTENLAILAFKMATADSLNKFNMVDGVIDDFQDTSGVDASGSTNEIRSGADYYSGVEDGGNYWGTGADGALTTSGNVTHTVQNKSGSYDGDMVVKQYSSLTIAAGHTMTVDQPCRGLFIYVNGNCTINGTLSMAGKSGYANPTSAGGSDSNAVGANGLRLGMFTSGGTDTITNDGTEFNGAGTAVRTAIANQSNLSGDGTIFTMSRLGGGGGGGATGSAGNGAVTASAGTAGTAGATGAVTISTGGGGGGGSWRHHGATGTGGNGGASGVFGGGSGGGAAVAPAASMTSPNHGVDYGGAGGAGISASYSSSQHYGAAGGAGNPGGAGDTNSNANVPTAVVGAGGGVIWLLVNGTLTIGSGGSITAIGTIGALHNNNAASPNYGGANGGSSGGGAIFALSSGTFTNNGTITAAGGAQANTTGTNSNGNGGAGGAGGVHSGALLSPNTYQDMTLISTQATATAAPTLCDIVILMHPAVGTSTINTHLIAYIGQSANSTPVYTSAVTLQEEGTQGVYKIWAARNVDTSALSGTNMNYKITTHNQAVTKETRVQSVSLAWR